MEIRLSSRKAREIEDGFLNADPLTDQLEITRRLKMNGLIDTGIMDFFEAIYARFLAFADLI